LVKLPDVDRMRIATGRQNRELGRFRRFLFRVIPSKDFYNIIGLFIRLSGEGGVLPGTIAEFMVHPLGGTIPVIGDLIAGFAAGYIAKIMERDSSAGFSGSSSGRIILAIILPFFSCHYQNVPVYGPIPRIYSGGSCPLAIASTIKSALIGLFGGILRGAISVRR